MARCCSCCKSDESFVPILKDGYLKGAISVLFCLAVFLKQEVGADPEENKHPSDIRNGGQENV